MIIYFNEKVNTQFKDPRMLQTCVSDHYDKHAVMFSRWEDYYEPGET